MNQRESGFTLVELLIAMVMFVFVIVAASQMFTGLLTQFKQQGKIAETNIESIVGIEILRQDLEHAGYGLPWNGLITYNESGTNPFSLNDAATGAPRAVISQNNVAAYTSPNDVFNGSDYLAIKSINVARNNACEKSTTLQVSPFTSPYNPRTWTPASENLSNTDRVIVISPGGTSNQRALVVNGSTFYTTYANVTTSPWPPTETTDTRIIYGVDPSSNLRMPFNRADYYISSVDTNGDSIVPGRCSANTGVLVKAVVSQSDGSFGSFLPIFDCVADMQVIYRRDTDSDGTIDNTTDDISALTAQQIRTQVKEVRVYILAHEGQKDPRFTYSTGAVTVGEFGVGRTFNLTAITDWQNYRWKVHTLVVKPNNLE